ncbi:hypothetical protein Agub_g13861 [Astrephomene gubernaculifera]|uniref:Reverse transcriptase domain-containing protein n=1 Tax=Astrephomene gubernaculifera TaxID=47775 RepID=A0AAD3E4V6_9CHLO|nr:hypothetical protein Agub_g13861 [Astrephomene gubernaculifera]
MKFPSWVKRALSLVGSGKEKKDVRTDVARAAREIDQVPSAQPAAGTGGGPNEHGRPVKKLAVTSGDGMVAQTARAPESAPRIRHRKEPATPAMPVEGMEQAVEGVNLEDIPGEFAVSAEAAPAAKPQPPVMRGRLRAKAQEWHAWVSNPLVLSWIVEGFPLSWEKGQPPPPHFAGNHASAEQHADFVDQAISDLLTAKSILEVPRKPRMVCPLGVVEQGTKKRLIYDARPVNDYLHIPKFRYEDLKAAPGFLLPDDFVFTLDLKSGYHHLDIREDCWQYLGFQWRGRFYVFTQLPFGLASACWAFTKLTREVLRGWRRRGWRCSGYLDDQFHADQDPERLVRRREVVLAQLENLGFVVNREKSMLGAPAQRFRYLGMLLDTKEGVFIVPEDKRTRVLDAINLTLNSRRIPVRALASIKGQLLAMGWAFGPWSRLRTRGLGRLIETRRSWSSHLPLSDEAREDLLFWQQFFDHFNGKRKLWEPTKVYSIIHCDAAGKSEVSLGGWGAWTVLGGQLAVARGGWDPKTRQYASTPQELKAVLNALRSFDSPAGLSGHAVKVITDNLNTANIINKGAAKADACYEVAYDLLWFCVERDIRLQAEWRPRERNQLADYISKMSDPDDWSLQRSVFKRLSEMWGPFEVDLFASDSNHHLPTYYSRFFTPDTAGVDAFRFHWGRKCWANPPFSQLLRVLRHAQTCRARLCLVAPVWPSRDWWSFLTEDGCIFRDFVHGMQPLGWAAEVFSPGERAIPRGAGNWLVMALLLDFAARSPRLINVPDDPVRPRPQRRD